MEQISGAANRQIVVVGGPQHLFSNSQALTAAVRVIHCSEDQATCLTLCESIRPALLTCRNLFVEQLARTDVLRSTAYGRGMRILAVVPTDDPDETAAMIRLGCSGVISSSASLCLLRRAALQVLEGELWAPRSVIAGMLWELLKTGPAKASDLTPREEHVLGLHLQGLKNHEIAAALFISVETVRWHKRRLYRKVGRPRPVTAGDPTRKLRAPTRTQFQAG
jgi:DNA-binding NarL/FixJ family response regulator